MEIIDNVNHLLGDNLKPKLTKTSRLKIATSCFSIYAYEALKEQLQSIESLEFIFTSPTFVPGQVTDSVNTIADIARERIRRVGREIKEAQSITCPQLDIGFRAMRVDSSNMKDVYYSPDNVNQDDLFDQASNIKEDREPIDLLFQVLLDWGVDLSLPIAEEKIKDKTVFFVDQNALAACFDTDIDEDFVKELAARKPIRAVFRDASFGNDSVKINVEQIFKMISPATELRSI